MIGLLAAEVISIAESSLSAAGTGVSSIFGNIAACIKSDNETACAAAEIRSRTEVLINRIENEKKFRLAECREEKKNMLEILASEIKEINEYIKTAGDSSEVIAVLAEYLRELKKRCAGSEK